MWIWRAEISLQFLCSALPYYLRHLFVLLPFSFSMQNCFFLLCRRASCQNGCKWKLKKRTASSSPGVSPVQACSPHCASIWHQLFGRSPSKHFAVSCSSFSAANFNQFKQSLQQQRQQQLGKEHVAPTAVTLCLPLPVAICQLEIIKGCPAANAVFFPPPLLPPLP